LPPSLAVHRALVQTVAVVVYLLAWVSLWHLASAAALATGTSLWYPPAALTFSLLAVWGPRWVWLPAVASLVAGQGLWQNAPTVFELAGSFSHAASYLVAAVAFRMAAGPPRIALTPRTLASFVIAGLVGALLSAVLGTLNHELAGLDATLPPGRAIVAWFAGDALAIASLAPFLVFAALPWHRRLRRAWRVRRLQQAGSLLLRDLAVVAAVTVGIGVIAWTASVEIVPISALAAGGLLIILAGRRVPRQSLTTLAIAISAFGLISLVAPAQRDLIEGGLVMLVGSLLVLVTTRQTMALRRESLRHAGLSRQISKLRRDHDTAVQELDRMKTRIAEVGHELRTPLNAIIGFAGLIRMTAGKQETSVTAERAETIEHSGEYLLLLINDIVDQASLRLGRLSVQLQPTEPADAVRAVARMLDHRAATKDQPLDVTPDARLPYVTADPVRLKQVLVNFAQNAIKYSPRGTPIALTAQVAEGLDHVCLSVVDEGPGLAQGELDLALQPFTRVGDTDREGGSGIGLPLAIQLVQEMGGGVDIETAPGRGTAVHVRLPVDETVDQSAETSQP